MKFLIERTSCYSGWTSPCDGASLVSPGNEFEYAKWSIDVNSLEELMALAGKEGELIVSAPCPATSNLPCIEIYDTYRE